MGYNSMVGIVFNAEAVKLMTDELKRTLEESFQVAKVLDDGYMVCYHESVKWYDELDDVGAIVSFMQSLDDYDQAGCEFLCLGQDDDDNTRKTYGNYHECRLWFDRSISLSGKSMTELMMEDKDNG